MKAKKIIAICAVAVILSVTVLVLIFTYKNVDITYDGRDEDVYEIMHGQYDTDYSNINGIADVIVKENLKKTHAMNDVASIVFDFRGFDTLGESFILLTAIAGSFVILAAGKKTKKKEADK